MNKQVSLGELAIELGINKSRLAYYFSIGLIKPTSKVGKMNIFDSLKTLQAIKDIDEAKKNGKKLRETKKMK